MEILINPPKEIDVTKEELKNFTYMDLACFWCNWPVAFSYDEEENLTMYTGREDLCYKCRRNYRFQGLKWYEIQKAGMYYCMIPKGSKLFQFITLKLSSLIMK